MKDKGDGVGSLVKSEFSLSLSAPEPLSLQKECLNQESQMHQPQSKRCFTVGYGNYPIDRFIDILRNVEIDMIVDVRSTPYSRFNPHFNRENLEKSLQRCSIGYWFMGDKIGGRYSNPNLLFPDGTVNYRKVQDMEKFQEGINEVLSIISSGKMLALLCAEKEPERCHRFALISPVLQSKGISVIHIRPDGNLQTNEDLERELVLSFPSAFRRLVFMGSGLSDELLLPRMDGLWRLGWMGMETGLARPRRDCEPHIFCQ